MSILTFTTDFGSSDWFAGTMQGVVLGINPEVQVVHLTHGLPRGDIRAGAFSLMTSARFFPAGTVHVVVVDPGVGSERKAIAVQSDTFFFVGPDNGVLSWALRGEHIQAIHSLENADFFLGPVSPTFHGRDIFAPAAAHLSKGVPIQALGPALANMVQLPYPEPRLSPGSIAGEVLHVDRFGNAITNLDTASLSSLGTAGLAVLAGGGRYPISSCYSAVENGEVVCVLGSTGFLEVAVSGGSAASQLGLQVRAPVQAQVDG